jgi:phage tail sheath gpL-like
MPLTSSNVAPGLYADVTLGAGALAGSTGPKVMVILTEAGSAFAGTRDFAYGPTTKPRLATLSDAASLFGDGSAAYHEFATVLSISNQFPTYVVIPTVDAPNVETATRDITFTGPVTSAGVYRVFTGSKYSDFSAKKDMTAAQLAAQCAATINAIPSGPCSATAALGVVTVSSRTPGAKGNELKVCVQDVTSIGKIVGATVSVSTPTFLSGGLATYTLTTTAKDAIEKLGPAIIVNTISRQKTTQTVAFESDVDDFSDLLKGAEHGVLNQVFKASTAEYTDVVASSTSTLASNRARECTGVYIGYDGGSGIVAAWLAVCALARRNPLNVAGLSMNFLGSTETSEFGILTAPVSARQLSNNEISGLILGGLTPIGSTDGVSSAIVYKIVTGQYKTDTGEIDPRVRDEHKVVVVDQFVRDLKAICSPMIKGKTINSGAGSSLPGQVSANDVRQEVYNLIVSYDAKGFLDDAATSKKNIVVNIDPAISKNRINVGVLLNVVETLDQIYIAATQGE